MNYKEYLLTQSAINLQYIAERMWPTNKAAKSYLSTKINDKGRPWTESDNEKAKKAIYELGMQLIRDAPNGGTAQSVAPLAKEVPAIKKEVVKPAEKELTKAELWKQMNNK